MRVLHSPSIAVHDHTTPLYINQGVGCRRAVPATHPKLPTKMHSLLSLLSDESHSQTKLWHLKSIQNIIGKAMVSQTPLYDHSWFNEGEIIWGGPRSGATVCHNVIWSYFPITHGLPSIFPHVNQFADSPATLCKPLLTVTTKNSVLVYTGMLRSDRGNALLAMLDRGTLSCRKTIVANPITHKPRQYNTTLYYYKYAYDGYMYI